ncbi:hypothetical protein A2115_02680 [Candidatus Woesebacteria bacterium GWA1_41_8]|uniref:Uncharacterized protein n=1 Tax=Candidatus Woesebacteria bacterium GWA1_41_8 TaxID=1802471 RepID=A0A1F7WI21_9BACT|nr:MAG: hypothetical protein A2115_02680 [Candidatus Woesebacteria bacterium GWA1_41_8]
MPIGPNILLKLVKSKKLVEGLAERELTNPEGAGFDLRLGEVYKLVGKGFLGLDERSTPETKLYKCFNPKKVEKVLIRPGDYYVVKTLESVNIPEDLVAYVYMRSTLHRSGVVLFSNQVNPGYIGGLSFGMTNLGRSTLEVELGARFCHIQFERVEGGGSKYRGQWQGGRVSATKKEKQV